MNRFKKIISISLVALFAIALVFSFIPSCESGAKKDKPAQTQEPAPIKVVPEINYTVVKKLPHNITSFTEGFLFHDKKLFESTGAPENLPETRSSFGIVNLENGNLDIKGELDKKTYFGEGIVFLNNYIYQLTYTNQVGFIYDAKTFKSIGQFGYQNKQGWGLTTDGAHLVMSDGTNVITYLSPNDFKVVKTLNVTENGYALDFINELEFIKGYLYANVWMTNFIVKIDPNSGEVLGKMDLSSLTNEAMKQNPRSLEMNGIAYDSIADQILVTGKMWPSIYEINFPH